MRVVRQGHILIGTLSEKDSQIWVGPKRPDPQELKDVQERNTSQLARAMDAKKCEYGEIHASNRFGGDVLRTVSRQDTMWLYTFFSPEDFSPLGDYPGKNSQEALDKMLDEHPELPLNNEDGTAPSTNVAHWDVEKKYAQSWTYSIKDAPSMAQNLEPSEISKSGGGNFRISFPDKSEKEFKLTVAGATKAVYLLQSFIQKNSISYLPCEQLNPSCTSSLRPDAGYTIEIYSSCENGSPQEPDLFSHVLDDPEFPSEEEMRAFLEKRKRVTDARIGYVKP